MTPSFSRRYGENAGTGVAYNLEHRIVVEGTVRWVRERAKLECNTNGMLQRVVDTMQNITLHMLRFFDPQT
jgi:hypothetical protein